MSRAMRADQERRRYEQSRQAECTTWNQKSSGEVDVEVNAVCEREGEAGDEDRDGDSFRVNQQRGQQRDAKNDLFGVAGAHVQEQAGCAAFFRWNEPRQMRSID